MSACLKLGVLWLCAWPALTITINIACRCTTIAMQPHLRAPNSTKTAKRSDFKEKKALIMRECMGHILRSLFEVADAGKKNTDIPTDQSLSVANQL